MKTNAVSLWKFYKYVCDLTRLFQQLLLPPAIIFGGGKSVVLKSVQ
jgi:hypothetical protein